MLRDFLDGLKYSFKGISLASKKPKLLALGILRLVLIAAMAAMGIALALAYHDRALELVWTRPQSAWIVWLWYMVSWLFALVWAALASIASYLIAQIFFSLFIMDLMSRITEQTTGSTLPDNNLSFGAYFGHLIRQEIPRTIIPVIVTFCIMGIGWFTFLAPMVTLIMPPVAAAFLAWESTDLVPARKLLPFSIRWAFFRRHFPAHVGFGLPFLVPVLNIVLLSFAPVGGTLLYLKLIGQQKA